MIELGVGADLFRLVGGVFWIVLLGALAAALLVPKSRTGKAIAVAAVVGLFAAFPGRWAWERKQTQDAYIAKRDKAMAIFNERCKGAGEKIYRTVEGVEGILLMKLRPVNYSPHDQHAVDPYGSGTTGDVYLKIFLGRVVGYGVLTKINVPPSYKYVDVFEQSEGKRYRYTSFMGVPPELEGKRSEPMLLLKREPAPDLQPRYGVTYDDITTPEERQLWIAGSSLKVIDLQTNEVIAERIGYMVDKGQGNTGGGRQPWTHAYQWSCPSLQLPSVSNPANFVEKVLKVNRGENK